MLEFIMCYRLRHIAFFIDDVLVGETLDSYLHKVPKSRCVTFQREKINNVKVTLNREFIEDFLLNCNFRI